MTTLAGSLNGTLTPREVFDEAMLTRLGSRKTLVAFFNGGASQFNSTPREHGTTSGYLVPSGKKFIVASTQWVIEGGVTGKRMGVSSGSTDVGISSASPPAAHDFSVASAFPYNNYYITTAGNQVLRTSMFITIPAGRYVYARSDHSGASWVQITGYEIDANAIVF